MYRNLFFCLATKVIDTEIYVFVENVQTEYTAVAERLINER